MKRIALSVFVALATAAGATSQNLAPNPRFDDDVAEWGEVVGTMLEWSPSDELQSPGSGSMKATVPEVVGDKNLGVLCIPAIAGKRYSFGIDARIPPGQNLVNPRAYVRLHWSTGVACNPTTVGAFGSFVELEDSWGNSQGWHTAPAGTLSAQLVTGIFIDGSAGPVEVEFDNTFFFEDSTCGASPTALCLNDGRFLVGVEWETPAGDAGYGRARPLTDDSGYFWFFNDANVELVTKLLDACSTQFNTFWFFGAGLTNVETRIRVQDTETDNERVYVNPQGTPFAPIQDTDAFDTCLALGG